MGSFSTSTGSPLVIRRNSASLIIRPSVELVKRQRKRYVVVVIVTLLALGGILATFQGVGLPRTA